MNLPAQIHFTTEDGTKFFARAICPDDKELIKQGFSELSERSKYLRFFAVRSKLKIDQLIFFSEVDGKNHVAWGIVNESGPQHQPVGIGRLVRVKNDPEIAEIAIAIVDAYQRKGMGKLLFCILNIIASQIGIRKLRYHVLADNQFVMNSLKRFGDIEQKRDGQVIIVETRVFSTRQILAEYPGIKNVLKVK